MAVQIVRVLDGARRKREMVPIRGKFSIVVVSYCFSDCCYNQTYKCVTVRLTYKCVTVRLIYKCVTVRLTYKCVTVRLT